MNDDEPGAPAPPNDPPDTSNEERAAALQTALTEARASLAMANARLVDAARRENPGIPPDLIAGTDPAAIDASVEAARALAGRFAALQPPAVPARVAPEIRAGGGPAEPDLSTMTPMQKIAYGLKTQGLPTAHGATVRDP